MNKTEAERLFQEADTLYREGEFEKALVVLDTLNEEFPNKHRLMYPRARCLARLGRSDEAIEICDRLLDDFEYERAGALRQQIDGSETDKQHDSKFSSDFESMDVDASTPELFSNADPDIEEDLDVELEEMDVKPRRIKPIRLLIAIGLLVAAFAGKIPWWVAITPIVLYFVMKYALKAIGLRLLSIPFKMKGKALAEASFVLNSVSPGAQPREHAEHYDDEEHPGENLEWFTIDITITPQERTEGFTHWEPGELALASTSKPVKKLDDLEHAYSVAGTRVFEDGKFVEDEGYKLPGSQRIELTVKLPKDKAPFLPVYYQETLSGSPITL